MGLVIYDNELETKEHKNYPKIFVFPFPRLLDLYPLFLSIGRIKAGYIVTRIANQISRLHD